MGVVTPDEVVELKSQVRYYKATNQTPSCRVLLLQQTLDFHILPHPLPLPHPLLSLSLSSPSILVSIFTAIRKSNCLQVVDSPLTLPCEPTYLLTCLFVAGNAFWFGNNALLFACFPPPFWRMLMGRRLNTELQTLTCSNRLSNGCTGVYIVAV